MTLLKRYEVTLSDGRTLEVAEAGSKGDPAIIAHNGTPVGLGLLSVQVEDALAQGLRIVTYGRPGYGKSTRESGRSVADAARDTAELADLLGIERFGTWGHSGGGPHALACGAVLGNRVVGVVSIAGVAPYTAEGLDFMAGMGQDNLDEFGAALKGEAELEAYLQSQIPDSNLHPAALAEHMSSLLCPADVKTFAGRNGEETAKQILDGMHQGLYGWFDDDRAFTRDWGFAVEEIRVPVQVWQGSEDLMVPFTHGQWLTSHIPGLESHLLEGEGHMSIMFNHIHDMHSWLATQF